MFLHTGITEEALADLLLTCGMIFAWGIPLWFVACSLLSLFITHKEKVIVPLSRLLSPFTVMYWVYLLDDDNTDLDKDKKAGKASSWYGGHWTIGILVHAVILPFVYAVLALALAWILVHINLIVLITVGVSVALLFTARFLYGLKRRYEKHINELHEKKESAY